MGKTYLMMNIAMDHAGAFLVYFMQAGFAMVETDFTGDKHAEHLYGKCDGLRSRLPLFLHSQLPLMFGKNHRRHHRRRIGFYIPYSLAGWESLSDLEHRTSLQADASNYCG